MKFKQIFSLIMSAAIAVSSLNTVFSAEYDEQPITVAEETALSDSSLVLSSDDEDSDYDEIISTEEITDISLADSGTFGDGLTWTLDDSGKLTISGTGTMPAAVYNSFPWYSYKDDIYSLVIESGVTNVGATNFYRCSNLKSVSLPNTIISIDENAFCKCTNLTSITIPDSVITIDDYSFASCDNLTSIVVPDSVTSLGKGVFNSCNILKSVSLSKNISAIDSYAFDYCYDLESIEIPDSVTSIGLYAFDNCSSLTSITIPDSVTYISGHAFSYCNNLTNVKLSNNISKLYNYTFGYCSSLESITLPASVNYIQEYTFENCSSLKNIYVDDGSETYSSIDGILYSKDGTELLLCPEYKTDFTIYSGATTIGQYAFSYYRSTKINIPNNITTIGEHAFERSKLTEITIPNSVTNIDGGIFYMCEDLTTVNLPDSITSISGSMFSSCSSLASITIPDSVTSIDGYAFSACTALTSITIPDSVTSIGNVAFSSCKNLKTIDMSKNLTYIGGSAFGGCSSLTSITIPDGVTSLNSNAFDSCTSLTSIDLPEGLTYIGSHVFEECTNLQNLIIPSTVTSISQYAFYKCTSLSSITVPDGVTEISNRTFQDCSSLKSVVLPAGITFIGEYAFYGCSSLPSITIPDNVTSIDMYAFAECKALTSLTIPASVTLLGYFIASNCTSLTTITILSKDVYTFDSSFKNTSSLKTVYCYKDSTVDDSSLYPSNPNIIYLDGEGISVETPAFKVVGVFGGRSVTFTSETDGAVIYYSSSTSNITTNDICVQNGETVTYEDYYGTIYARAYYNGVWSDVNKFVLKIPVVNTPTVKASGSNVTIKSTTPSSFICYTTDGSEPIVETDGTLTNGTWLRVNGARTNSGTVTAEPGDTVRAVAVRSCFTTSASAAAYVNVSPAAFTVVGTFGGRNVTFKSDTSGAKIYYSSTTSSLTTSDKCVSNGETVLFENFYGTIYARAYYNGKWSNVSRLILKIPTINTPTVSYSGGKATIRTTTPSCYIYYTTDGSTPSVTNGKKLCSNSYGQVSVSSGTTIKAIAVRSCFTNSEVVSCTVS